MCPDQHRMRALSVLVCVLAGVLMLVCAPVAFGLPARGHAYDFAFGSPGSGEGELSDPSDVAVDEATGEVYVVDAGDERVEVFKPAAGGGYQFVSAFRVDAPGAIAVDNSTSEADPSRGMVYVAGGEERGAEEDDLIYEYDPVSGEVVHHWHTFEYRERAGGIEEELELEEISGLAVDASGRLWVYWEEEGVIDGFAKETAKNGGSKLVWEPGLRRAPEIEEHFECEAGPEFALAPGDEAFYAGYERESSGEGCPGEEELVPDAQVVAKLEGSNARVAVREVDHQDTTGVAVDPTSGQVYVDNGGSVAAFTAGGAVIQRFGEGRLAGGAGVAVDGSTGDVFVPESGRGEVAVFAPEQEAGAPEVDGVSAQSLTPSSTRLEGQIDPKGLATEYVFEYGTSDCASEPAACTALPAGHLAAGFGDQSVSVEVTGLEPATAYYYRLVANNARGNVQGVAQPDTFTTLPSPAVLPDGRGWELVSPSDKHGAAVEVSSRFRGASVQAAADGDGLVWPATGPVLSEPQGSRSFELSQLLSTRGADGWETQSLETAHGQGRGLRSPSPSEYHFFSPDLSTSLVEPTEPFGLEEDPPLSPEASEKTMYVRSGTAGEPGFAPVVSARNDTARNAFGGDLEFLDATGDLRHVVFESTVGLTEEDPSAAGLYEWDAASQGLRLVSVLPDGAPAPDESSSPVSLGEGGGLNERGAISQDGSGVFWTDGHEEGLYLRDASRGETIKINAAQGNDAIEPGSGGQTLPEPAAEQQLVHFQAANPQGSIVFFTDTARLSEESAQEPVGEEPPEDLYEFQITSGEGEPLRGRLTDLTPDENEGSADVLNLVLGVGEDGGDVYFVANGVLAPGASRGECVQDPEGEASLPQPGATCNLYVSEPDPQHPGQRVTRFIAALSYQDASDWGAGLSSNLPPLQGNLAAMSATVSPNGNYLAFMSQQNLTGYDPGNAGNGVPDEEVYLYDAQTHRLACASCNPQTTGEGQAFKAPEGLFDIEPSGESPGLLVDRPELWRQHTLAGSLPSPAFNITDARPLALYQPRDLLDDGRLFFDSPDDLVPAADNHTQDVYQYEPQGLGSCTSSAGCIGLISSGSASGESAFLDAGENGEDVFFLTAAQLVPADTDHAYDIYDAHVCSPSSPCPSTNTTSTEPCETAGECKGLFTPTGQVEAAPATSATHAPEPPAKQSLQSAKTTSKPKPLSRAQKLAKALTLCRAHHRRSHEKRAACERRARKSYGPKKPKQHNIRHGAKTDVHGPVTTRRSTQG